MIKFMDLQPEVITLFGLITTTIGGVLIAFIAYKTASLGKIITKLEKNTNSIKDALVKETAESSHAKGVLAGKEEQKVEDNKQQI